MVARGLQGQDTWWQVGFIYGEGAGIIFNNCKTKILILRFIEPTLNKCLLPGKQIRELAQYPYLLYLHCQWMD